MGGDDGVEGRAAMNAPAESGKERQRVGRGDDCAHAAHVGEGVSLAHADRADEARAFNVSAGIGLAGPDRDLDGCAGSGDGGCGVNLARADAGRREGDANAGDGRGRVRFARASRDAEGCDRAPLFQQDLSDDGLHPDRSDRDPFFEPDLRDLRLRVRAAPFFERGLRDEGVDRDRRASREAAGEAAWDCAGEGAVAEVGGDDVLGDLERSDRIKREARASGNSDAADAGRRIGRGAAVPVARGRDPKPDQARGEVGRDADDVAGGARAEGPAEVL
jgi:hypothetical protein